MSATVEHTSFTDIPLTARNHFRVNFHAAAFHLVDHLRRTTRSEDLDGALRRLPFLAAYFEASAPLLPDGLSWAETRAWWETSITRWEDQADAPHLPLRALRAGANVEFPARMALLTTGMVEEDSRFGAAFADLRPAGGDRPALELVGAIVAADTDHEAAETWAVGRALVDGGLVDVPNRSEPRSQWLLQMPPEIWDVVRGEVNPVLPVWGTYTAAGSLTPLADLVVAEELASRLAVVPALVEAGQIESVVVRGMQGADRRELVASVARSLGRGVLHVEAASLGETQWVRLGPLCSALGAMPVVSYDLAPGETADLPALLGYAGPLGIVLGTTGGLQGAALDRSVTLEVPPSREKDRRRRWEAALAGHPVETLDEIAQRFRIQSAHIDRLAPSAIAVAALDRRDAVTVADVQAAGRTLNRQLLDTLASRIEPDGRWEHLIVGEFTAAKLAELEARCRHRERVLDHLGPAFGASTNAGVRALFTGSSGTGKTLAARILGAELGLDVYRLDLSAVVNKYVGETEKNLHKVLSTAEELDVLLLIDEGDALLGSRTEVRSANDRFANLETNYLLQRLEGYQGVVVVTTNAAENIDSAFQRRMDVVVSFVEPGARERWDIWQVHLPDDHAVEQEYLEQIAVRCEMTGGQIRNAAMHSSLLAVGEGLPVLRSHMEQAVAAEYQKAGALSPFDPSGRSDSPSRGRAFLEALL